MADKGKVKRGGRYCVAGGPNKTSCKNSSYAEVVSMHYFPSVDDVRQKWTTFVRRHRKDFVPSKMSTLCSVHFEESCFEQRAAIFSGESANLLKFKRFLIKGAIPTRDMVVPYSSPKSARKQRKVSSLLYSSSVLDQSRSVSLFEVY